MPLYEMVVLCRIGETQAIANLIKSMVYAVYQEGGVIRKISNLGDRISDKSYKSKDGKYNSVIRYMSFEIDANPETQFVAQKVARGNSESLQVFVHKLNEKEYFKQIFNRDAWKEMEINSDTTNFNDEMVKVAAKQKIEMGKDFDKYVEQMKNKFI
jgi:hypothetical protein